MSVSVETFRRVALEDGDDTWELECGRLTRKPPMTMPHNTLAMALVRQLMEQLPEAAYDVRANAGHVKLAEDRFAVPDVAVIPRRLVEAWRRRPHELEEYSEPLPLVVEVWSRSTGGYDVDHKLPAYRARGDLEIWRIHPYERTVMVWRKDADGDYAEDLHRTGGLHISSLPECRIDLDRLFAAIDS